MGLSLQGSSVCVAVQPPEDLVADPFECGTFRGYLGGLQRGPTSR